MLMNPYPLPASAGQLAITSQRTQLRLWLLAALRIRLGPIQLMLLSTAYIAATQNRAFWSAVWKGMPAAHGPAEWMLLLSLALALCILILLPMLVLGQRRLLKTLLMTLLMIAAVASYFMDTFGVVIDQNMILNSLQTDPREARELLSARMMFHVLLSGVLPCLLIWRVQIQPGAPWLDACKRAGLLLGMLLVLLGLVLSHYKTVSLWAREHREVRLLVNPTLPIAAAYKQMTADFRVKDEVVQPIGTDAMRVPAASGKPRVVVMVVGETVRRSNFQLAGYARETTPQLAALPGVFSFNKVSSCGTATAISVPCMFSRLDRSDFSRNAARGQENVLDVLAKTGVDVLWRDNNSDCKGVCVRVPSEDLRRDTDSALCDDGECHDEILLKGLAERIRTTTTDQLIVLHLLGSHGPSYYKRYPQGFRHFVPDCARDDVQTCSRESIINAYDNTILYTDHVIANAIKILSEHGTEVEPTLLFVSDHGESLGENGLYLHGMPYALAPRDQTEVPLVVWSPALGSACTRARTQTEYSHDNIFDTLLGLFHVQSRVYRPQADMLAGCGVM